jgi:hypothetical protein
LLQAHLKEIGQSMKEQDDTAARDIRQQYQRYSWFGMQDQCYSQQDQITRQRRETLNAD